MKQLICKFSVVLIIFLCFILPLAGSDETGEDYFTSSPTAFVFSGFLQDTLPGAIFFPSFIENYAPDMTLTIEESNAFALIDNPRVYFEGNSFVDFNWYSHGLRMNSAINPGSPAIRLPFSASGGYLLQSDSPNAQGDGMHFLPAQPVGNVSRVLLSTVYTDLGSYTPWLTFMVEGHASTRDDRLYTTRRKTLSNFFVDYLFSKRFDNSLLQFSLNYFDIQRQFNDFNDRDATFEESGRLFMADTRFKKELRKGSLELFATVNWRDRSNLYAELGNYPDETTTATGKSFVAGIALQKDNFDLRFSFQYETEKREPTLENYSKNLFDADGDGIFPGSELPKIGDFSASVLNLSLRFPLELAISSGGEKILKIEPFLDGRHAALNGKESINEYNGIFAGQTPYLVVTWSPAEEYSNSNTHFKAGVMVNWDLPSQLALLSKVFVQYSKVGFQSPGNDVSFFTPGYDLGLQILNNKKTQLFLSYGMMPKETRENINDFLEVERPSGTIQQWNDLNNDGLVQAGEQGALVGYTGPTYHSVDENLAAPMKQRLLLSFSTKISKNYVFQVKGILRRDLHNFAVRYPVDYGFYEEHNGQQLYFFNSPMTQYVLTNYDYDKDPFYAQLLLQFKGGVKDHWFFNFSFMAHMGMGVTAFGNGPGSNDIGVINESMANPNSWINGFGRLDGDRAFMGKIYFGRYLAKDLSLGVSFKYRDGSPFAFIDSLYEYNQWVLYYSTIKAEDEKGVKGGPREDYVGDLSFKLNYRFSLFNKEASASLEVFNVLDLGHELSEYVFSGGSRDALELNIPRSVRFTLTMNF